MKADVKSILIVTGAVLTNNPRVVKEAGACARAGFRVTVLGAGGGSMSIDNQDRQEFTFIPATASNGWSGRAITLLSRIRSRLARDVLPVLGLESHWQLGPSTADLLRKAKRVDADYYIVHTEAGIWVGAQLLKEGRRVGVDLEDWYSEDLPPESRRGRPVRMLRKAERELLTRGAHATCPSAAMSAALARAYHCVPPSVVYNAFPWGERRLMDGEVKDRRNLDLPSIHWFSQTLGPDRGLQDLLGALPLLTQPAEIHLRGKPGPGFSAWLAARVPQDWRDRLFVHDVVPPDELSSRIAEHDVGFAGEMNHCRSRMLTVTNKILYYLLGGLAVVASDTDGQKEVAERVGDAVCLYPSGDPQRLSEALNGVLSSPDRLRRAKASALTAAQEIFCWERQEETLLTAIQRARIMVSAAE